MSPTGQPSTEGGAGAAIAAAVATLLADAPFVRRALAAELGGAADEPALAACLSGWAARPWDRARLAAELDAEWTVLGGRDEHVPVALRRVRRRAVVGTAARDVAGVADLGEVTGAMTALAELAVQRLLAVLAPELARVHGVPASPEGVAQDLLVVAMGKGGSGELNVSSDLDLIFVFDADGSTRADARHADTPRVLDNAEFFTRLGQRLIAGLSEAGADGFVFRVDMRLRPNGDAGPLVVSNGMLEEYLVRQGREWERFAWQKARVISAPVLAEPGSFAAQCAAMDAIVRPFVYRKYLDFGAIAALRELHELIRAETQRKSARGAGGSRNHEDNVKLGRGGIREIEFIAQTFQIIRGGRDPRLRERGTRATLAQLAGIGALARETCARLVEAYVFLRRVEHALQYVEDAQTHRLPEGEAERARIARLLGLGSAAALMDALAQSREFVAGAFDAVFAEPAHGDDEPAEPSSPPRRLPPEDALAERLEVLGFAHPHATAARLTGVLATRRVVAASEATRAQIERLLLRAVEALGARTVVASGAAPDEVAARFAGLIEALAGRSTYLALLVQYRRAFERVLRLLAASRWATDYLVRHPVLLDELIDERLADLVEASPVEWSAWRAQLAAQLAAHADDPERQMNLLRDAHHAQVFRLLVADLDGRLSVERLADHLSLLADTTLAVVLELVWRGLPRRHRPAEEGPRFAVIGYGKLGGKELGYASDLDLVFVGDDEHPDAAETHAALARRLILWLSTQTSSGALFEVDLRLRPNGDSGLPVTPWPMLERYLRNEDGHGAWTWEHQALTRARFVCGDAALGARFEALRAEVLARPRDVERLRSDVLDMRRRMLDGHPNRSGLFDLKHDRGGMVDIEFIVQTLVLAHAHAQPRLLGNLGNIALLRIAGELGLIDAEQAAACANAYRTYRRIQHRLRLNGAGYARVPAEELAAESAEVRALWRVVLGTDAP